MNQAGEFLAGGGGFEGEESFFGESVMSPNGEFVVGRS
jgi:hypothetical protein